MKKILDLKGVQTLSRGELKSIKGAWGSISCCTSGRGCQISFPGGSFCEPGYCDSRWGYGRCILY
ncbi:hypothetical protein [Aquimarina brevivitae]|uniref:Uncharacterized protein n=1 Tax=Aquimarina brevivitae TaxID=323412 RepID=A0A4Q7P2G6_9FLAO|nr:hypothetical protein [Aquimarina brevivitae]RZS93538.1 hypothetical protein EV197_2118 [Aquimarina brevivitae]